jgi:hypothetical protein
VLIFVNLFEDPPASRGFKILLLRIFNWVFVYILNSPLNGTNAMDGNRGIKRLKGLVSPRLDLTDKVLEKGSHLARGTSVNNNWRLLFKLTRGGSVEDLGCRN